ncbi:MAG: Uncharacterised protein [Cyanobium sp. ARS6]|nr:MAG: Uncharacterised protein [Cyanobium sp. ARS6]
MFLGDVVDQFLNQHGLADTRTTEEANFSTLAIRSQEIDHLDAGLKDLRFGLKFSQLRCRAVNRSCRIRLHGTLFVNRLAQNIEDATQCSFADRH